MAMRIAEYDLLYYIRVYHSALLNKRFEPSVKSVGHVTVLLEKQISSNTNFVT